MDEIKTRRFFITDAAWNRTTESWKQLKPFRNFESIDQHDETIEAFFERLQSMGFNIPLLVLDQWIYLHYYNCHTVNNYGWIDYKKAQFAETFLPVDVLKNLYVIEEYKAFVENLSNCKPFEEFNCSDEDLEHWKAYNTWRTPPIVLKTTAFSNAPDYAELGNSLQLVEGHTRLGYLYALEKADLLSNQEHKVFLFTGR